MSQAGMAAEDDRAEGRAANEEQGADDAEDEAEGDHGEGVDALDALGVGVVGACVSLGHDRRHDREDQGDAVLAEQRERDCQANCRVGVDLHADAEDCGLDAADDGVWWLGTSDGHVADGHELVRTADDETGLHVAEDETDDGTGDDGLVQ